jgi:probable F420-dependent oxidoreductase
MNVVEAARSSLGQVGAFLPVSMTGAPPADVQRAAARRLEDARYGAAWTNEIVGGKDALVQVAMLLAATNEMAFATGIANIWARPPQTAHAAAAMLSEAFPGRFVLGLGAGYPFQAESVGREYGKPVATMREYLDQMASPTFVPAPDAPYAKIIGATGPKMLALSGEVADGAIPIQVPPAFTARARQNLGPNKLLVIGLTVVADAEPDRARATARQIVAGSVGQPGSYSTAMAHLGYSEQEISEVSDALVDAVIAHGDDEMIAARVREHLAAGADHVALLPNEPDFTAGIDLLERLAPALVHLRD